MSALSEARANLERRHWYLLAVLGVASFFDGYDSALFTLILPDLRDTFDLTRSDAAIMRGVILLGALPALWLARRADKIGRRRVLLVSIVGYTLFGALTSLSQTAWMFAGLQFFARLFVMTESAVAHVLVAEELPAKARGFGFAFLALLTALGVGLAAGLESAFTALDVDWRWLFLIGVPPLLVITYLRRNMPESKRFEAARDAGHLKDAGWRSLWAPPLRRWLILVCAVAFVSQLPKLTQEFAIDFLEEDRGIADPSLLLIAAGLPAVLLMLWAGALSDRLGRRIVGCVFAALGIVGGIIFYTVDAGVMVIVLSLGLAVVGFAIAWPTISAYTAELFPTAMRSQAGAAAGLARASGEAFSLFIGGLVILPFFNENLTKTAMVLLIGPVIMIVLLWRYFPDTHGRELEDTSHEEGLLLPADLLESAVGDPIPSEVLTTAEREGGSGGEQALPRTNPSS